MIWLTKTAKPSDPRPISDEDRRLAVELRVGHLKQVTTLALSASGGVITLGGSVFANSENLAGLWLTAGVFALGGGLSFTATIDLIRNLRIGQDTARTAVLQESLATGCLGFGLGMFLYTIITYASLR